MKTKLQITFLIAVLLLFLSGCASTPTQPALTREECGPFPENYAKIAEDYGTTTKVLSAQSSGIQFSIRVTPSPPQISNDRLHPGWLVGAQRVFVSTSEAKTVQMSLPFQIIIYDGKIVWTSDDRYTRRP